MNAPADISSPRRPERRYRWPLIIVGLLVGHTTLMLVAVTIATRDPGFAVDPSYYQKSLQWDQLQAQRRASEQLGWKLTVAPIGVADTAGHRQVTLSLADANGQAIDAGTMELTYFHHAHGRDVKTAQLTLDPANAGRATATLEMPWPGVWQFDLIASARGQTFLKDLTVEVLR